MPATSPYPDRPGARRISPGWRELAGAAAPALALLLVVALPLAQVREFELVNYDDPVHVGEAQPVIHDGLAADGLRWSLTATDTLLWHPLTWISYMADVTLFGAGIGRPGAHHVVNLVLHLLAVLVLFILLRLLGAGGLTAAAAAALYGLHPLQAEPVAWVSARKDVLGSLMALLAVTAYTRLRRGPAPATPPPGRTKVGPWPWRMLLWLALAAALLSKPSTMVLPGLFVIIDVLCRQPPGNLTRAERTRESVRFLLRRTLAQWPFLLLAGAVASVAVLVQHTGHHTARLDSQAMADWLLQLPARLGFYLQRTLWPLDLGFDYPAPSGPRRVVLSVLGIGFVAAIPPLLASRGPALRRWGLAMLWYGLCLAPVLLMPYVISSFTNDRYTHLALAGPALALGLSPRPAAGRSRIVALLTVLAVVAAFSWLTRAQTAVWRDDGSLFTHAVRVAPGSATAWTNLGSWHALHGMTDEAMLHYEQALAINPCHPLAGYNLARMRAERGEWFRAITLLQRVVDGNPAYAPAHHALGLWLGEGHDPRHYRPLDAIAHLRRASQLLPREALYVRDHAKALLAHGETEAAREAVRRGLDSIHPRAPHYEELLDLWEIIGR